MQNKGQIFAMTFILPNKTYGWFSTCFNGKTANHWLIHKHMLNLFFTKPFFDTKAEGRMWTQPHPRVMSVTHSQFKTNLVEQSGSRTHTHTHTHTDILQMSAHASPINQLWIPAMNKMNGVWSCWLLRRSHLIKLLQQNLYTNVLFTLKIFQYFFLCKNTFLISF